MPDLSCGNQDDMAMGAQFTMEIHWMAILEAKPARYNSSKKGSTSPPRFSPLYFIQSYPIIRNVMSPHMILNVIANSFSHPQQGQKPHTQTTRGTMESRTA
ncbi:hypothetical protein FRB91_011367 [Serendipita sp. 411]|nr:hypothetical protein FRC15_002118 [Serendipita sp. 397]KAG8800546.1 hypothetical protein FRC16_002623 [Serendipita sp. 398]KAG8857484.1 hypothetical protein FRB91_011367 [Serendipita sp. 411]KAG9056743.1 hypothetical protein FS842_009762 [Serendipita sp. 407]